MKSWMVHQLEVKLSKTKSFVISNLWNVPTTGFVTSWFSLTAKTLRLLVMDVSITPLSLHGSWYDHIVMSDYWLNSTLLRGNKLHTLWITENFWAGFSAQYAFQPPYLLKIAIKQIFWKNSCHAKAHFSTRPTMVSSCDGYFRTLRMAEISVIK